MDAKEMTLQVNENTQTSQSVENNNTLYEQQTEHNSNVVKLLTQNDFQIENLISLMNFDAYAYTKDKKFLTRYSLDINIH